ncbi:glutathione S-transferase family protein [Marinobacterium weihaiense]|uniref:Glutathione S-transferase family protein n=1 Tax=Marinobacterium weihaiense TaxID=2851016 RepID=A0ABS6MBP3_9GAMM|nr:glutathione S-transferase family protein [Marinobacterium weihaiense]MBV0933721.1 glutathione S-transferase family protein [Marinobacterium weihaiense]
MGLLIDGRWHDQWYDTKTTQGRFERSTAQFRNWITADGDAGPSGEGGFKAEAGRYHLYVSLACPWAHRTLIMRRLKGLDSQIGVSVVNSYMGENGWSFADEPGATGDDLYGLEFLYQLYLKADPHYSGRVTVPVLWDRERQTIVSNESADILRMLNSAFDALGARAGDYYPPLLRSEIDTLNGEIYDRINNGVYKAGFATRQDAYEQAVYPLFEALDALETRLSRRRYLLGDRVTEADWRLFTTLIRFDAVYHGHFKCNLRRIVDYPHLWGYVRELYQWPGIAETVDMAHIKGHYYRSHATINPTGIVPAGPELDLSSPHERQHLSQ